MKLRNNKHIKIGLPIGSIAEGTEYKTDYGNLEVKNVGFDLEAIRFDVDFNGNELRIYARTKDNTGKTDLEIVNENKQKLLGMLFEDILNFEMYRDASQFSLVVTIGFLPLQDGRYTPWFQIEEYDGPKSTYTPFECDSVSTEEEAKRIALEQASNRIAESYGEGTAFKIRYRN